MSKHQEYPKALYHGTPKDPDAKTKTVHNAEEEAEHKAQGWKTADEHWERDSSQPSGPSTETGPAVPFQEYPKVLYQGEKRDPAAATREVHSAEEEEAYQAMGWRTAEEHWKADVEAAVKEADKEMGVQ